MPLTAPERIESQRFLIRLTEEADLPGLLAVNGDEQVNRHLPYARWESPADAQAWYARMLALQATGTALQWSILDKATAQPIGACLLFRFEAGSARAELGYVLGRAHWGGGCMHEALAALIDAAFGAMALRRLEAEVNPQNVASVRLLQRLGFVREGLLRQRWVAKGATYDVAAFGLLRGEWRSSPSQKPPA